MALWLKMSGAVDHVWEGLGGPGGFDATCGYPGEGPPDMGEHGGGEGFKGKKNRMREARGFLKLGTTNVTSWKSFMDDFVLEDSELRKGHVWAVQEHKLADDHACAQAQADLAQFGWKGFFTPAGKGPKGYPSGGVGWIWQEWLSVGALGEFRYDQRCVSIELSTPKIGVVLLFSLYGWTDDNVRTLALVDKVIKNVGRTGLPWGILGDFNYGAKDMHNSLADGQVKNAKVMTVGNTCFTKDSKSAIDYGIVDRALAPWMWHGRTVQTGLATRVVSEVAME